MKYIYIILFLFIVILKGLSQSQSYKDIMTKQLSTFKSAKEVNEIQKVADGFYKIAESEKKEWLAFYYAGLCNVLIAFEKSKTEIDTYCDKAEDLVKKADSLEKNNSEIFVLKSMISAARILVNEKARGRKYGTQSAKYANEAIKLDSSNPRAYLIKGQNLIHIPEAFGGGIKKAKSVLEIALEKEKTFKPQTSLHPNWAKLQIEKELKDINQKLAKK